MTITPPEFIAGKLNLFIVFFIRREAGYPQEFRCEMVEEE